MINLWKEQDGVSAILGTLLIFTVLVGLYASVQVNQVPVWNRQLEFQSFEDAYDDLISIKSDISDVAALRQPKSASIRMGTRYPDRAIFINSGQGVQSILSAENMTITVNYTLDTPTNPSYSQNYTTSRLIYESRGSVAAKIVYEHGLVIRDFSRTTGGAVTTDRQELIVGDELYVPVLDSSRFTPLSAMKTASLTIKPFTASNVRPTVKSMTVSLPTAYPEIWQDRLEGLSTASTNVTVDEAAGRIIISSNATKRINFPAGNVTGAGLFAGLISLYSQDLLNSITLDPNKTILSFDPTTAFPRIESITLEAVGNGQARKTTTTITAIVKNVTGPADIHVDMTDLTKDIMDFDERPTYSTPLSIVAATWDTPNTVTVKWENITHPEFETGDAIVLTFWVYNGVLNQQYPRTLIEVRQSQNDW